MKKYGKKSTGEKYGEEKLGGKKGREKVGKKKVRGKTVWGKKYGKTSTVKIKYGEKSNGKSHVTSGDVTSGQACARYHFR